MVVYPWVHQYTNNLATKDQTRRCMFPDISPLQISSDSDFSMVAGDFTKIYTEPSEWSGFPQRNLCFFIVKNLLV